MRLWSLHPRYLDTKGLTAVWREALLARAVLSGLTRGYHLHPQLQRFLASPQPEDAINEYLAGIHAEASTRGYSFDRGKLVAVSSGISMTVTEGQMLFELEHLGAKLRDRDRARLILLPAHAADARPHPLFRVISGPIETWERGNLEGGIA